MSKPPNTPTPVREGEIVDAKFRVEHVLGGGGMGVVVAARQIALDRLVALKFLSVDRAADPEWRARLTREARAAARLESEHVARVLDVTGIDGPAPYIVIEHLQGEDLGRLVTREGELAVERAIDLVVQCCDAIAEAHARGIVHRDIKPANLFLSKRGDGSDVLKVLDFGISKIFDEDASDVSLTETSAILGSPLYMSPEQLRSSRDVTARSDVWSIGVVLYELLTSRTPFEARSTTADVVAAILGEPAPPIRSVRSDVPKELARTIARCLERDPSDRMPSVVELAVALGPFGSADARRLVERIVRRDKALSGADGRSTLTTSPRPEQKSSPTAFSETLALREGLGLPSNATRSTTRRHVVLRVGVAAGIVAAFVGVAFALSRMGPEGARSRPPEPIAATREAASSAGAPAPPSAATSSAPSTTDPRNALPPPAPPSAVRPKTAPKPSVTPPTPPPPTPPTPPPTPPPAEPPTPPPAEPPPVAQPPTPPPLPPGCPDPMCARK